MCRLRSPKVDLAFSIIWQNSSSALSPVIDLIKLKWDLNCSIFSYWDIGLITRLKILNYKSNQQRSLAYTYSLFEVIIIAQVIDFESAMITRTLIRCFTSTAPKLSNTFPYPFEYTACPSQFKFVDSRFDEYPAVQKLFPLQKDHISYVIDLFQNLINKNITEKATAEFIDKRLIEKVKIFRELIKNMEIDINFNINKQKFVETYGYLEYTGLRPELYMHDYIVTRKDEKVIFVQKQQLKSAIKKTSEQHFQNDVEEIAKANSVGESIKKKIFKSNSKKSQIAFKIADFFKQSYEQSKKHRQFQTYYLSNKINATMDIKLAQLQNNVQDSNQEFDNIALTTKWYYHVTSQEPESVRKSRKRVLYDFQLWNRGCFVPIKNFVQP